MPLYHYEGRNQASQTVKGERSAPDEQGLYEALRDEGIFLVECSVAGSGAEHQKHLKPMQLSEFARQIATMTGAGITLSRAMSIMQTGLENKRLLAIYSDIQKQIQQGRPLSEAMENTAVFPDMMLNMFRAGEASGQMEKTAAKLADHYQKEHRMNNRIRSATLYPKILAGVAVLAILVIFLAVMPTIEPLFEGMELPLVTKILMGFSRFMKQRWYVAVLIGVFPFALWQVLTASNAFCYMWDKKKLHLPLIGKQLKIIYTARFSRNQSSLYTSGLSMIKSLEIASKTLGNTYIAAQFSEVIRKVRGGEMLSRAIQDVDGLDKKLAPTIFVGEETGRLDTMLESIADNYEYESDIALTRLTGMIEPAMILVMGLIIGLILMGVMLPLWNMYGNMG